MLSPDAFLKAVAAVVCGAFGALLLGLAGRSARWRLLGVFLALIAGNQAAEAVRSAAGPGTQAALLAFRAATVCASLDPLVLLLVLRRSTRAGSRLLVGATGAAALAMLLQALFAPASWIGSEAFRKAFFAYTALAYLAALTLGVLVALEEPRSVSRRFVLAALVVAIAPVLVNFVTLLVAFVGVQDLPGDMLGLAAVVLAGAFLRRRLARASPRLAGTFLLALSLAIPLTALLDVYHLTAALRVPGAAEAVSVNLGRGGATIRWLLFGSLASIALIRYNEVGLGAAQRRLCARVLAALGLLTVATLLLITVHALGGAQDLSITPTEAVLLAGVLVLSQGFRSMVESVAVRVYGLPSGGSTAAEPEEPMRLGALVRERYRVDAFLGRGGFGRVYRVHDLLLRRDVVVKELLCDDEGDAERVLREARIAGAVRHPNVVAVHDAILRTGSILVVQEFVEGGTLGSRLAQDPPAPKEAEAILDDVLRGLATLHAKGIVHGDLNPSNVLLTAEGRAKIADFGVSAQRGRHTVAVGSLPAAWTPGYVAPEVARGGERTPASDVYAAGLLAQRLVGEGDLVRRALDPDPAKRWPDGAAMLAAFEGRSLHVQ